MPSKETSRYKSRNEDNLFDDEESGLFEDDDRKSTLVQSKKPASSRKGKSAYNPDSGLFVDEDRQETFFDSKNSSSNRRVKGGKTRDSDLFDDEGGDLVLDEYQDEEDEDEDLPKERCFCVSLQSGMVINALLMISFVTLHFAMLLVMVYQGTASIDFYVAALLRGSWTYIFWLTGFFSSLISLSVVIVNHPVGRVQVSMLNLLTTIVFTLAVAYNGYASTEQAYLGGATDRMIAYMAEKYKTTWTGHTGTWLKEVAMMASLGAILHVALQGTGGVSIWVAALATKMFGWVIFGFVPGTICLVMCVYASNYASLCISDLAKYRSQADGGIGSQKPLLANSQAPFGSQRPTRKSNM